MVDIKQYTVSTSGNKIAAQSSSGTEYWYPPIKIIDREHGPEQVIFNLTVNGGNPRRIAIAASDAPSIANMVAAPDLQAQAPATQSTSTYRPPVTRAPQRYIPASVTRAIKVATVVEVVSWICLGLSVIGGLIIAASTESNYYGDSSHPNVGLGIAIAVGGAFQCLLVIMAATYVRARLELTNT